MITSPTHITLSAETTNHRLRQMVINMLIIIAISSIDLTGSSVCKAQQCHNLDFEFGDTRGWRTFIGSISDTAIINLELYSPDQHAIMSRIDGNDPIAELYCIENNELPIVPPGLGAHVMRLGNSSVGAHAERVVYEMTVDQSNNFFTLSYAVVLEDPQHSYARQPRFEMRILDSVGNVFPCGEYQVRADLDLEGFENCQEWRVRPWTTAGFELESYRGQTIKIEILTTDCGHGGHAGYAYFDATCYPPTN